MDQHTVMRKVAGLVPVVEGAALGPGGLRFGDGTIARQAVDLHYINGRSKEDIALGIVIGAATVGAIVAYPHAKRAVVETVIPAAQGAWEAMPWNRSTEEIETPLRVERPLDASAPSEDKPLRSEPPTVVRVVFSVTSDGVASSEPAIQVAPSAV